MDIARYDSSIQSLISDCERLTVAGEKDALRALRTLRQIAAEREDNALLGFVHFYYASWYYDRSEYERFQKSLERAIRALLRSNARDLLARVYNFFAIDAQINEALDVAYSYYMSALRFADEEENLGVTGIIIQNLANFYHEIGDYSAAHKYHQKAIRLIDRNKRDPFYHRNALIAQINEGVNLLALENVDAARRAYAKAKKRLENIRIEQYPGLEISFRLFEARLVIEAGDAATADEQIDEILREIHRMPPALLEMEDLRGFCYALMRHGYMDATAKLLAVLGPHIEQAGLTHALRMLAEIRVEYYDRCQDEKKLLAALREQHSLLVRLKEEKARIYQYSMRLIQLVGDLQEEERTIRMENEHLQNQILTDDLTGIPNRYALDRALDEALDRAAQNGWPLGVAVMDVDGFKSYNDAYGHQAGDDCLVMIGDVLRTVGEEENVFCARYGGDEFVVIYENRDEDAIRAIAARIASAVAERPVRGGRGRSLIRAVTISQGVCIGVPHENTKPWDFLAAADAAMYAAKGKAGRSILLRKLSRPAGAEGRR